MVVLILAASLGLTIRDYFRYASDPLTGYAFQSAAVELGSEMARFDGEIWASERFQDEWESIPYLIGDKEVTWLPDNGLPGSASYPVAMFLWPYGPVESTLTRLPERSVIEGWTGPLIKGDLEEEAYPLYWSYRIQPIEMDSTGPLASFDKEIQLETAKLSPVEMDNSDAIEILLTWSVGKPLDQDYKIFVHVSDGSEIIAQDDTVPAGGTLPTTWWRPGDRIMDRHTVSMPLPYEPGKHEIRVGLYLDNRRLAVRDSDLPVVDDAVILGDPGY